MKLLARLRTTPLDAALAGCFLVVGLVQVIVAPIASPGLGELFVAGSSLPLAWRRTSPIEATLATAAFWLIPLDGFPYLGFVAVLLQFFALGHRGRPGRSVVLVAVVACAASALGTLLGPEEPIAIITAWLTIVGPVVAGRLLRREQERNQALIDLNHELADERRRAEEAAVGAERARVAQELHDVVGHEVTLIAIQAEAAASALRLAPERAAEPVESIRTTAHRTLTEIRGVLEVLAPGEREGRPTGEDVRAVVDRAREAGIPGELSITGAPGPEQTSVALAVNRIVRECLTNAARHAPGNPVQLEVTWHRDGVDVRSTNRTITARPVVAGRGLTGIRHRAELLGGTFHLDGANGCFDVRVSIPSAVRR